METRVINSKKGKIIGEVREKCVTYTSVPYAITERFESPRAVEDWDVFDATARPKNCHQRFEYYDEAHEENNFYYREFDFTRDSDYVETPMTLTIITPIEKMEKCPVIVYLHGGSFENGHSEDTPFGTCYEYAQRGIVLVSVGYRLNVFGLYDSNNYGLQDQIFACNWVKENIEAFGGDKDNITLMGQSAGAMCVNDLLLTQKLKGVIKGAIMMSGAGVLPKMAGPDSKENNHGFWMKVMENAGCETVEQLKKVDAEVLWRSWYQTKNEIGNFHTSVPSIDGDIIPLEPHEVLKKELDLDIPLIVGVTSQDMFPALIFDIAYSVGKRAYKKKRSPVYGYFFDVDLPGNCYRSFHASDLWYMFGNMDISWRPFDDKDREISQKMIDYVANFVRYQNPNGHDWIDWEPISKSNHQFRWFTKEEGKMIDPMDCRKKLLHSMLKDKGPF